MAAGFIASQLAVGLLKGAAGKVGALIVDQIFPSSDENYFGVAYAEISKVVKQVIEENTIKEVDGAVNGLKNWVKDTYAPRKASKFEAGSTELTAEDKTDLRDLLSRDLTTEQIGKLQEESFAEAGLGVFMIAAGVHLALLQELAFVDPDVQDPATSSYVQSIKKTAQRYVAHATATIDNWVYYLCCYL